ncbi:phage-associated protein%2C HI1409 family [Campylobacter hyointestinalis subsp. hyointestinalis]|uniref:Phage-associated protein, HI1409 family n=1 Tax=Campylobacter hyointestinalis subsp. hyointestinalis TaxID=91352 RepID=A0A9W5ER75_CAMHY|nr:DUF1073 domain-containing protein [Campylobacter hyointestinalis]CUU67934.1 phage-associated protein%2C HI1409 family [Campylobacter hyointestinalis subsp. hyointestinalis]
MFDIFKKKTIEQPKKREIEQIEKVVKLESISQKVDALVQHNFQRDASSDVQGIGMDSATLKEAYTFGGGYGISPIVMQYFAEQSFIGYQTMSLLAQNWLISKACIIPAKDAIRNGYDITFNSGDDIDVRILDRIRELDKDFKINTNLVELSYFNKVFGIRICMFEIDSTDPQYYEKPFNIDSVKPKAYKGISQIDPVWITPILNSQNASDPSDMDFYVPEYWLVSGRKIHKSHLIIVKGDEVADILKPTYRYGGISLTQKIFLRVYSAERTANEAPMLVQTKRTNVRKTDIAQVNSNIDGFKAGLEAQIALRDNYGTLAIDLEEEVIQLDTSLAEVDTTIMTQYQLVAGIANIPIVKLLGTQMKGFSSGLGEYEAYYQELENEQNYIMTPLLDRHYQLLIKSYIEPEFGFNENATVVWKSVQSMSAKEKAEIQEIKSRTDATLANIGAIDGEAIQKRIITDPDSGYMGAVIETQESENILSELLDDSENKAQA